MFLTKDVTSNAGSTATLAFIAGTRIWIANVGDSNVVVSVAGIAQTLGQVHKPTREDELRRIRDAGGFVIHNRVMGELAVSRAFGDRMYKQHGEDDDMINASLVTCDPEMSIVDITDAMECIILASDGLWDVMSDQEVVNFVKHGMKTHDIQQVTALLVEEAIDVHESSDNVTAVIVALHDPSTWS